MGMVQGRPLFQTIHALFAVSTVCTIALSGARCPGWVVRCWPYRDVSTDRSFRATGPHRNAQARKEGGINHQKNK